MQVTWETENNRTAIGVNWAIAHSGPCPDTTRASAGYSCRTHHFLTRGPLAGRTRASRRRPSRFLRRGPPYQRASLWQGVSGDNYRQREQSLHSAQGANAGSLAAGGRKGAIVRPGRHMRPAMASCTSPTVTRGRNEGVFYAGLSTFHECQSQRNQGQSSPHDASRRCMSPKY
jgi:hypothetical protein